MRRSAQIYVLFLSLLFPSLTCHSEEAIQKLPPRFLLPDTLFRSPSNKGSQLRIADWFSLGFYNLRDRSPDLLTLQADSAEISNANKKEFKTQATTKSASDASKQLLEKYGNELGLTNNAADLRLIEERKSLKGVVLDYQQEVNGIPIDSALLSVAISKDGDLQSVSSNIVSVPAGKTSSIASSPSLTEEQAKEIAWKDLRASGKLLEPPSVTKAYLYKDNTLKLSYLVSISISEPFGYWRYYIDATTGAILKREDRRVPERTSKRADESSDKVFMVTPNAGGPPLTLEDALTSYKGTAPKTDTAAPTSLVSSRGIVFDPDPVTTLMDDSLTLNSPEGAFMQAYRSVELTVQNIGGVYRLSNNSAVIADFEPGVGGASREPSVTESEWTAYRDSQAFRDVMAFFYVNQSLQRLRALGYTGELEKFPSPIFVDTDGLNGADNSHYVPGSDRLAFGAGCVPDTEDAAVILHEFGHAITYHLNNKWAGGDSQAIGEGFADYWAASYIMNRPNGATFNRFKVFKWDGIESCWGGRRLDRTNARYNPAQNYYAHQPIAPGYTSDELWSTPLYNSLLELISKGESVESVDQVILESMEKIGSGFSMRDLALGTVATAKSLFPTKPHSAVFEANFKKVGILP